MNENNLAKAISEIGQNQLLDLLFKTSRGIAHLAQTCSRTHCNLLADFDGRSDQQFIAGAIEQLNEFDGIIDDNKLKKYIIRLKDSLQILSQFDKCITAIYASNYSEGLVNKKKLKKKIYEHRFAAEEHPEFEAINAIAKESEKLAANMMDIHKMIELRVSQLIMINLPKP